MDVRKLIQRYGVEYVGRFYSKYRGIVIENNDPDNQGKLYIWVPSIFDGIKAWAYPVGLYGGPNTGFKYLSPPIGSTVWVTFEKGDPCYPVWEYHGWFKDQMPDELQDSKSMGFITPNGNKVILKETEGDVEITLNGKRVVTTEGNQEYNFKEFIFNGGGIGLPQTTDLVSRLNLIEQKVNTIIAAIGSGTIAPTDGGAAFKASLVAAIGEPLIPTIADDIQSETIKQTK